MGRMLFWGQQGVSRNIQKAVRHYERGAVHWGDPVSMYDYAIVLLQVRIICLKTDPVLCVLFFHTNHPYVLFHYVHTSPPSPCPDLLPGSSTLLHVLSPKHLACNIPLISWFLRLLCILFNALRLQMLEILHLLHVCLYPFSLVKKRVLRADPPRSPASTLNSSLLTTVLQLL